MLSQLFQRAAQSHRLERRFKAANTLVVVGGTFLAFGLWIPFMIWSRKALGLPLEGGSLDGLTLQFLTWVALILAGLGLAFYLGVVLIASVVASVLFAARALSWKEVVDYTLRSKYPKRWYVSKR